MLEKNGRCAVVDLDELINYLVCDPAVFNRTEMLLT